MFYNWVPCTYLRMFVRRSEEKKCHRRIHSRTTVRLGTVYVVVAIRASPRTIPKCAATHLDIHARRADFPASCTEAVALYPCRCLYEPSCNKQAEGYTEYFHRGAIKLQSSARCSSLPQGSSTHASLFGVEGVL